MAAIVRFVKTMVLGGRSSCCPLIVVVLLLYHAVRAVAAVRHPSARACPDLLFPQAGRR